MAEQPAFDLEINLCDTPPPIQLLRARKALLSLRPGQTLHVMTDSDTAHRDFVALAKVMGEPLVREQAQGAISHFIFQKR